MSMTTDPAVTYHSPLKRKRLSTSEYAELKGVKGETVRQRLYKTGGYYGDKPERGPNGRLLWPIPQNAA